MTARAKGILAILASAFGFALMAAFVRLSASGVGLYLTGSRPSALPLSVRVLVKYCEIFSLLCSGGSSFSGLLC